MRQLKNFMCPITPVSHELHNIVIGGEGVGTRRNGVNAEKTTFSHHSLRVSQGLLLTIVQMKHGSSIDKKIAVHKSLHELQISLWVL